MTDANQDAQKHQYQLMTVRAMAQNRQPSGGYKQEPDHVSLAFSLFYTSFPFVVMVSKKSRFLLRFFLSPLSPFQLLKSVGRA